MFAVPGPGCETVPNFATTDIFDTFTQTPRSLLAALDVEAWIQFDSTWFSIGGFYDTCPEYIDPFVNPTPFTLYSTCAYLNRSQPSYTAPAINTSAFLYIGHYVESNVTTPFPYTPVRGAANVAWPPLGMHLRVDFVPPIGAPIALQNVSVSVHYEIYDSLPVYRKWVSVSGPADISDAAGNVQIGGVVIESLRTNSNVAGQSYPIADGWVLGSVPLLVADAEVAHGAGCIWGSRPEATYASNPFLQCLYTPQGVSGATCHPDAQPQEVCPGTGEACAPCGGAQVCPCPSFTVPGGAFVTLRDASSSFFYPAAANATMLEFVSFRARFQLFDSTEQERRGLARRRVTRTLAPWTTENPIFVHWTNTSKIGLEAGIAAAASVGVEMIIQSFGTSFNMEDNDPAYLAELTALAKAAAAEHIELGGYDLINLDRSGYGPSMQAIDPATGGLTGSTCFASAWVDFLTPSIFNKMNTAVGMKALESDGPYGGQLCAATNHSHHKSLADSVYWQDRTQSEMFQVLRAEGIYINAPDIYFAAGANKMMFYGDPSNNKRARLLDLTLSRQMLYDATYEWLTSQGWAFIPIDNYDGGGVEAIFAPLEVNVRDYDFAWATFFGYGVAGVCWRGMSFYDGPLSQAVVTKWIIFYKMWRETLTYGALVHVRRPDGQNLDAVLHTNPTGGAQGESGLLFVYNPTGVTINSLLSVNLYYTGLTDIASFSLENNGMPNNHTLARDYTVLVNVTLEAGAYEWWVIR